MLTKTGFLEWRSCPKSFWLETRRPEDFPKQPPSEFARLLMRDGMAVEDQVKTEVASSPDSQSCRFQVVFETPSGLHARADLVRSRDDGSIDLFEIKASTSLKSSDGSDHVLDACFQAIVAERAGETVNSVSVIYVNKDYVRDGALDPSALLITKDVSEMVADMRPEVEREIAEALTWIELEAIDEHGCECRLKANAAKHCAAFGHLNPDIPDRPVYLLPRLSVPRLRTLDAERRLAIADVTPGDLTAAQLPVWQALRSDEAVIDYDEIAAFIAALQWPLWFYDYETVGSAVPIADGHRPHLQIPVQFSIHKLDEDGTLEHFEFLADQPGREGALVARLIEVIGPVGSLLAWNMSTEKSLNARLAEFVPEHAEFLFDLSKRTTDLMEVFKRSWVEPGFEGSTSIKKVLPVLVPELAYADEDVHDGTGAILAWREMVETSDQDRKADLKRQLLDYCRLDTLAMVRIFQVLQAKLAPA